MILNRDEVATSIFLKIRQPGSGCSKAESARLMIYRFWVRIPSDAGHSFSISLYSFIHQGSTLLSQTLRYKATDFSITRYLQGAA